MAFSNQLCPACNLRNIEMSSRDNSKWLELDGMSGGDESVERNDIGGSNLSKLLGEKECSSLGNDAKLATIHTFEYLNTDV